MNEFHDRMCAFCWLTLLAVSVRVNRQLHALGLLVSTKVSTVTSHLHAPFTLRSYYDYKPTLPTNARNAAARQGYIQVTHLFRLYVPCRTRRLGQHNLHPLSSAEPTQ
jgi:hypothetical protein